MVSNMKKLKYRVVEAYSKLAFESEINFLLGRGWKLQGGVSLSSTDNKSNTFYIQAMVQEDDKD